MFQRLLPYATVPLRWGVGFVFLYFGLNKYLWPQRDITQFIAMGVPGGIAPTVNFIFGALEIAISLAMFLGIWVRLAASLASLLLIVILGSFSLQFGKLGFDTVFRDVAILGGALSLIIRCDDPFCMVRPKGEAPKL